MIPCFENLVGIRTECGDQTPSDSGFYIQDLPFLNIKLADAIVTDQDSGIQLLRNLYNTSVNFLVEDVRTRMRPYFKRASTIENNIIGYPPLNRTVVPGVAGTYKGIQFQVRQSPYLDIFIPSITLWVDYSGTIPLEVWNLTTGKLLETISVTTVAGEPTILPETYKKYANNGQTLNIFIGYNTTGINSFQTNIFSSVLPGPYGGCRTCFNSFSWWSSRYVWIFSMSLLASGAKIQTNLRSVGDTGGLSVTYSLQCSMDKWLCQMRDTFGYALMNLWGVWILKEVEASNRLNTLVTLKKEQKEALMADYQVNYDRSMQDALRNVRIPNDICFNCNAHLVTGITIP